MGRVVELDAYASCHRRMYWKEKSGSGRVRSGMVSKTAQLQNGDTSHTSASWRVPGSVNNLSQPQASLKTSFLLVPNTPMGREPGD